MAKHRSQHPLDVQRGAFMELLEVDLLSAENGKASAEVVVGTKHLRPLEMAHGGLVASLLDTVLGMAAYSLCPDEHYSVTVQLDVKFTRPALPGRKLTGTAQVQHAGKRTAVSFGQVHDDQGSLIATGSATLMYLPLR